MLSFISPYHWILLFIKPCHTLLTVMFYWHKQRNSCVVNAWLFDLTYTFLGRQKIDVFNKSAHNLVTSG